MPLPSPRSLLAALQAQLPEPTHTPEEVQRRADDILARPEFRRPAPSIFERVQDWIAEQLGRVVEGLAGGGRGSVVGVVLLVLAIAAVVVMATRAARTISADPRSRAVELAEPVQTVRQWLADAEQAEAAGRWRDGLRCRYRALVAGLAERGVVEEVPGRTAGEYRADVAAALPVAADEFAGATDLFERAWYGDRSTGAEERDRFGALAGRVLEGAGR